MKHVIPILLMCVCSCGIFASYHSVINQYQLPADTRRVDIDVKCKSCSEYYTLYNVLYSEQIDTYFTNDFKPYYPKSSFICSGCKQRIKDEDLKQKLKELFTFIAISLSVLCAVAVLCELSNNYKKKKEDAGV